MLSGPANAYKTNAYENYLPSFYEKKVMYNWIENRVFFLAVIFSQHISEMFLSALSVLAGPLDFVRRVCNNSNDNTNNTNNNTNTY